MEDVATVRGSDIDCHTLSLVAPIGYQCSDCGYCRGTDTGASYFISTKSLCVNVYQDMMDRGWRRSGSIAYLPDASRSCCPHYTIRLPATEFRTNREHRQALNRWNRFVLGEEYISEVQRQYPKTKEEKKRQNNNFDFLETLHQAEVDRLAPMKIEPAHRFQVTLEHDTFTDEKYDLYDQYQRNVHHEDDSSISRSGFRRFLCFSPLHRHEIPVSDSSQATRLYGSYHQCYRVDGRLIAMAVLDLLPHAVSGVYFMYDTAYSAYSFGKLSALREIALALEAGYEYYYMGYYIHGCAKMRYKGDFRTQMYLDIDAVAADSEDEGGDCPSRNHWYPLDEHTMALMDRRKWVSMKREREITAQLKLQQQIPPPRHDTSADDSNDSKSVAQEKNGNDRSDRETSDPQTTDGTKDGKAKEETAKVDAKEENEDDIVKRVYAVNDPTAFEVMHQDRSLLSLGMPGIMSAAKVESSTDLGEINVGLRCGSASNSARSIHKIHHLVGWDPHADLCESGTLRGIVAELVGALGVKVTERIVIDFGG